MSVGNTKLETPSMYKKTDKKMRIPDAILKILLMAWEVTFSTIR